MKLGILMLRATIGGAFVGHGAQKLFGFQDGAGLKGTAGFFEENLGLKPGIAHATLAGVSEVGGGAGLLLGFRTPLAAAAIVGSMTTAIERVHGKNGWNTQNGGFEYNAVLIAAAVTLAGEGPGALSLDALRGKLRTGLAPALFALGAGVGGAAAVSAAASYFGGTSAVESAVDSAVEAVTEPEPISVPVTAAEAESEASDAPLPLEPLGN
jgi:putative oxidoreductase